MQFVVFALSWVVARLRSERAQDLLEYAMLGGLIAAAIVALITLGALTGAVTSMGQSIADCIDFKGSTPCAGPFN